MQIETYDVTKRETFKCPLIGQFLDVKLVQVIIIIVNHKSSYFLMICANNHTQYIRRAQTCIQIYMKTPRLCLTYQYLQIKKDCISFISSKWSTFTIIFAQSGAPSTAGCHIIIFYPSHNY